MAEENPALELLMAIDEATLSGLDMDSAKELILAYSIDAKRLEREIAETAAELDKWKGRLALVEGKLASGEASVAPLAEAAQAKIAELSRTIDEREAERAQMKADIARIREKLPYIKARERSIDPDRLLAELQMMTGELLGPSGDTPTAVPGEPAANEAPRPTDADFAKLEAQATIDAELAALKLRARDDGGKA